MDDQRKENTNSKEKKKTEKSSPNNYRPMTSLPMMWKMIIAHIRENIYYLLINRVLLSEDQKGCQKEQVDEEIYSTLINTFSRRAKRDENVAIEWVVVRKA